jgi:NAD dependent epimerase/dehydratase family enzyme
MTNPVLNSREGWTRTTIAITGSSGLIGSALIPVLERYGHEIRTLVRRPARTPLEISWDPDHGSIDAARLEGVDAVVHLAGETLGQRWTDDVKRRARPERASGP